MKKGILVVLLASVAGLASAAEISIDPAASGYLTWNSAIWGSPAAAPVAGNDYIHDSATALPIGSGAHGSFPGDSLRVDAGATLVNQGGGNLGGTIYLNGGNWQNRYPDESELLGNIRLLSSSMVLLIDGGMKWSTGLSCTNGAVLRVAAGYSPLSKAMVFNALDLGFEGTFQIEDNQTADGIWDVQFNTSFSNGVLKILGNSGIASQAAVYQLTNNISFKNVFMPDGSAGLVDLAPGTYDATALAAAGVSSTYYNDLGGTISVISVSAPPIAINPSTSGFVGWNTAIWGDPAGVPTSGNDYLHNSASAWPMALGAEGPGSFSGASLTVQGAALALKGGGPLMDSGHLFLDHGQLQTRFLGAAVLLGHIDIVGDDVTGATYSSFLMIDGDLWVNTGLSCASNSIVKLENYSGSGRTMQINAVDTGFFGTFSATDTGADSFTWNLEFNASFSNASLIIEGNSVDSSRAAIYQLKGDIEFKAVSMPKSGGGMVELPQGTYDAVALAAAGVDSTYYNDLAGTIRVGPIPANYETWAAGWDVDIGSETNDYDGDLYNNLWEYAMDGDPTNSGVWGEVPAYSFNAGVFSCVYAQRTDDANLVYYLETRNDLVSGSWTNSGYTVAGTNVTGNLMDYVTNEVSMVADETFVRVGVDNP